MAIVVFENHPAEPSCRLGERLRDGGHRLRIVELHAGDPVPPDLDDLDGVVAMGGPMNVGEADRYPFLAEETDFLRRAHEAGLPVVGVCLGAQLLADALGGKVEPMDEAEIGLGPVKLTFPGTVDPIFAGMPWNSRQFHAHARQITELPPGATPLASSPSCPHQAFKVGLTTYGFQYHFEWDANDIEQQLQAHGEWIFTSCGVDAESLRAEINDHYDLYRHLGDRLCRTLTDLVFPIDKRLDHSTGPVENFHASVF